MSSRNPRYCIPTAPILERINARIEELNFTYTTENGNCKEIGGQQLAEQELQINYRALTKQRWMSFDTADRILAKLGLTQLWYDDPRLRRAYQNAPLPLNERELILTGRQKELEARRRYNARQVVKAAERRQRNKSLPKHTGIKQLVSDLDVLEEAAA